MARMNAILRWLINRRNVSRSLRLLRVIEPHVPFTDASRVLELGAGIGGLSALIYERHHARRVVVSDFDPVQVRAAGDYLTRRFGALPAAFELRAVDAMAIPFPDSSFDAVLAIGVLHHVEQRHSEYVRRPAALAEIRRVLAPGGSFVYTEFTRTDEVRRTLSELGFVATLSGAREGHQELDIYRAPAARPAA